MNKRKELSDILEKYGLNKSYLEFTLNALEGFGREILLSPSLVEPDRFREVSANACLKEIAAIQAQADKLRQSLGKMSHTASTELFYVGRWQKNTSLIEELTVLVKAARKIREVQENSLAQKGAPKKNIGHRLADFLLRTWEDGKHEKAVVNSWNGEPSQDGFFAFVTDVFKALEVDDKKINPEGFAKAAVTRSKKK